jgi:hypothetical protein
MKKTILRACLAGIFLFGIVGCKKIGDERRFVNDEIKGVIIKVKFEGRDVYTLHIKHKGGVSDYSLRIKRFVEENSIHETDSISKEANDRNAYFYRKKDGFYESIRSLYY